MQGLERLMGCILLAAIPISAGCATSAIDPELSYVRIIPVKQKSATERLAWESDYSEHPGVLAIGLGAKEVLEARGLDKDLETALVKYVEPEIRRQGLCSNGVRLRLDGKAGSKRGDAGFLLDCFWRSE